MKGLSLGMRGNKSTGDWRKSTANAGLHPVVRAVHEIWGDLVWPAAAWARRGDRRDWAWVLLVGVVAGLVLLPVDGWSMEVRDAVADWLGGDARRELRAWGQYGAITSLIVVGAVILLLDRDRFRRALDLALAAVLSGLVCLALKMLIGRPRPKHGDPETFLGWWGHYPIRTGTDTDGTALYEMARSIDGASGSELLSMPSSHTAAAAVLSVFLWTVYPKLKPLAVVLLVVVGLSRVVEGAHYPSDVVVGGAVGLAVGGVVVKRWWGVRLVDWVWVRFVDGEAEPAYERMRRAEIGPAGVASAHVCDGEGARGEGPGAVAAGQGA